MTTRFLLDTNAVSEPTRPQPNPGFMARLERHQQDIALAATTWHELVFGVARMPAGRRKDAFADYLQRRVRPAPILPYDEAAAEWHAQERARLSAIGRTPSFQDGQIAAIAAVHNLVLVTENTRDFECFEGVRVENWKT